MGSSELKQRFEFEVCRHFLRMKKKKGFSLRMGFRGEETGKQLARYTVSEKEERVHLAGTEDSCRKWYNPEL